MNVFAHVHIFMRVCLCVCAHMVDRNLEAVSRQLVLRPQPYYPVLCHPTWATVEQ